MISQNDPENEFENGSTFNGYNSEDHTFVHYLCKCGNGKKGCFKSTLLSLFTFEFLITVLLLLDLCIIGMIFYVLGWYAYVTYIKEYDNVSIIVEKGLWFLETFFSLNTSLLRAEQLAKIGVRVDPDNCPDPKKCDPEADLAFLDKWFFKMGSNLICIILINAIFLIIKAILGIKMLFKRFRS